MPSQRFSGAMLLPASGKAAAAGRLSLLLFLLALPSLLLFPHSAAAASCADVNGAPTEIEVRYANDVSALVDIVSCSGGNFRVNWIGLNVVKTPISIGEGTSVTIIGVLGRGGGPPVMDGEYKTQLLDMRDAEGNFLRVEGVELTRGSNWMDVSGGAFAMTSPSSAAEFYNCTFSWNRGSSGGAISNYGGSGGGNLLLDFCAFLHNGGGGLYVGTQIGGAVFNNGNISAIRNCFFYNNSAVSFGGAVNLHGGTVNVIESSIFESNSVLSGAGGALYIEMGTEVGAIQDCEFVSNLAGIGIDLTISSGGAIHFIGIQDSVGETKVGVVARCNFTSNESYRGGAIYSTDVNFKDGIRGCRFLDNVAANRGGAIFNTQQGGERTEQGLKDIKDCLFESNTAVGGGGAIEARIGMTVRNTVFQRNVVTDGSGGGFNGEVATQPFEMRSCIFVENRATEGGGGATGSLQRGYITIGSQEDTRATPTELHGCAFYKNGAGKFGGGFAAYLTQSYNSSFEQNSAGEGGGLWSLDFMELYAGTSFVSNFASSGGGAYTSGLFIDPGVLFKTNVAGLSGGSIFVQGVDGFAWPNNATFVGSVASCCYQPSEDGRACSDVDGQTSSLDRCCSRDTLVVGEECTLCPVGFDCDGLGLVPETVALQEGYWRANLLAMAAQECFYHPACDGGLAVESRDEYCAPAYKGPYCAVCSPGYSAGLGYKCHKCDTASIVWGTVVCVVVAAVVLAITWYFAAKLLDNSNIADVLTITQQCPTWAGARVLMGAARATLGTLRTPIVVLQILAQFAAVTGISFPPLYRNFLAAISAFTLDFGWLLTWGCLIDTNFYDRLLVATLAPLAIVVLLALSLVLTAYDIRRRYPEVDPTMPVVRRYTAIVRRTSSSNSFGSSRWSKKDGGAADGSSNDVGNSEATAAYSEHRSEEDERPDEEKEIGGETKEERQPAPAPLAAETTVAFAAPALGKAYASASTVVPTVVAPVPPAAAEAADAAAAAAATTSAAAAAADAIAAKEAEAVEEAVAEAAASARAEESEAVVAANARVAETEAAAAEARRMEGEAEDMWEQALSRHGLVYMVFTFLIYSTVSTLVFQTFACDHLEGADETYLRADYGVSCAPSAERSAYVTYAAVMVAVYPFGIPAVYGYLLWRQRHRIADKHVPEEVRLEDPAIQSTRFLWRPYTRRCYWWELAECLRRLALTGFLVFVLPGETGQAAIACVFSVVSLLAVASFQPHDDSVEASIYRLGCIIIFLSMFFAVTISAEISDDNDQSQNIISILLIIMNVGIVSAAIVQVAIVARRLHRSVVDLPPPPSPSPSAAVAATAASTGRPAASAA